MLRKRSEDPSGLRIAHHKRTGRTVKIHGWLSPEVGGCGACLQRCGRWSHQRMLWFALVMRYLRSENELGHARKEEKQKVILSAAAKVVATEGTSASIARIVTEAEIPVGSLYTHFAAVSA